MTIAGIEVKEECLIEFVFNGIEPNRIANISLDGTNRDSVLISNTYNYTMSLGSLEKQEMEKLFAELTKLSNQYKKATIDLESLMRSEIPDMTLLENTAIDFEFDISQVRPVNRGGFYDMTIPLKFIEYF